MGQKVFSAKEIEKKRNRVKVQLDQLQAMKRLLLEEGIKPDEADKERESKLIQQVLGFEKDTGGTPGDIGEDINPAECIQGISGELLGFFVVDEQDIDLL